ncbi:MAG: hypothetical protein KJ952_02390 [Candidatus Omnitrophica bacterium]|nr:hypothetical protein [Candidatus Omnitrophota bacterium]
MYEFSFMGCIEIKELLGKKADDEMQLLEFIEEVPADSIYYHTHSCFLRHYYIAGTYTNDFANWVAIQVRDRVLGEKLASVTPSGNKNIDDVRFELIDIIDRHISSIETVPSVSYGQPFFFMQSEIIEIPTGITANNLAEFKNALEIVDASAIYNHIFEAKLRDNRGRSDFAIWIEEVLNMKELAEKIEVIDSYMYSLEGLRKRLLDICSGRI